MPMYMDIHEIKGATAEAVAKAGGILSSSQVDLDGPEQ